MVQQFKPLQVVQVPKAEILELQASVYGLAGVCKKTVLKFVTIIRDKNRRIILTNCWKIKTKMATTRRIVVITLHILKSLSSCF